jgi:hypothetical protein
MYFCGPMNVKKQFQEQIKIELMHLEIKVSFAQVNSASIKKAKGLVMDWLDGLQLH